MLSRDRIDGGHGGGRTDIKCYYSGTWMRLKPLIWAEGPPIGLYGTAVVQGLSSPWARWHSGTRDGMDAKKTDPVGGTARARVSERLERAYESDCVHGLMTYVYMRSTQVKLVAIVGVSVFS